MREMLFRGKRIDTGEWVYGDLIHRKIRGENICVICVIADGFDGYIGYEIDPSTVGQYTGLSDMCGKKIFEGDIVKRFWFGKICIYQIDYDNGLASFIGQADVKFTTFDYDSREFEIIGNIYDNPELLKERERNCIM